MRTCTVAVLLLAFACVARGQVDSVSISCTGGAECSSECANFCTAMAAFDPAAGAYTDVTASASNGFSITCSSQAEVDLIMAATSLHVTGNPGVSVTCGADLWIINDDCLGTCPGGITRTVTVNAAQACACDNGADDFSMRPCIGNIQWGGAGTGTCDGPSLTLTLSATLASSGGGGDPHIFSANLPRHLELHSFLEATTAKSVGDFAVTLMDMEGTRLVGHVSTEAETDRSFFTRFTLSHGDEEATIAFEASSGRAEVVVEAAGQTHSCSSGELDTVSFSDSSLRLQCSDAADVAAACTLMAEHFPSHIPHVRTAVALAAPTHAVEFFFVQKEAARPEFGFFDFQITHSPSVDVGGLFANPHSDIETLQARGVDGAKAYAHDITTFINANLSI